jgi:4-hydroxy-tetrahydrodipicolinate reductase
MAKEEKPLNIAILGAGRMAQELMRAIAGDGGFRLAGVWARKRLPADDDVVVSDVLSPVLSAADVAVDFSLPAATPTVVAAVLAAKMPLVIGVSGIDAAGLVALEAASATIPILYDRNMSLGIAVLDRLVRQAATSLGAGFEAEIHETHHRHKIDAPSGTALKLGESLAEARRQKFDAVRRYDPAGLDRPIAAGEIRFEVTREGEVAGEHTVIFKSESERLELKHAVSSRRVFADGALCAARWLSSRPPGLYQMRDLLLQPET